jgi:L-rhamnose mutarotase
VIRYAYTIRLEPGALDEYVAKHGEIWPEMVAELKACGIQVLTAFHHEGTLYYYTEAADPDSWQRLWQGEVQARWANEFTSLIAFREDGTLDTNELTEVWRLETGA